VRERPYQSTRVKSSLNEAFVLLLGVRISVYCKLTMSISTESTSAVHFGGVPERRANSRFPVQEEVSYRVIHSRSAPVSGVGATLNIGSGGILFTTRERLPVGRTVELAVNWPAKLGGTCPLRFVAVGRVVRSEEDQAAVRIQRYEFKTRSTKSETVPLLRVQASR
jgi:hypothetical protein